VLPFSSPVAVAASTLAAAALFNPLRRRVQRQVDRRFNRARYDAEASIAALTAKLRDAVDLETVQADLLDGVHEALAPRHASVWIRPADHESVPRRPSWSRWTQSRGNPPAAALVGCAQHASMCSGAG
jgi:hypothetical protein